VGFLGKRPTTTAKVVEAVNPTLVDEVIDLVQEVEHQQGSMVVV
jgi:hypothetical protein